MTATTFTLKSANTKVGPIPVTTTDRHSCPDTCPFLNNGCYFDQFRNAIFWNKLTAAGPSSQFANGRATVKTLSWDELCARIDALPAGQRWRHNQGGDLPHDHGTIDRVALDKLVTANEGKCGFTFSHHDVWNDSNAAAIADANLRGFTINLSANNLTDADDKAALDIGPVVVTLPSDVHGKADIHTPQGRRVVVCPQTYRENLTCADCGLCAHAKRKTIVGFPAHGARKSSVDAIVREV